MQTGIFLEQREVYVYPSAKYLYAPGEHYPEYPFPAETLSEEPNPVYDMVRASLIGLGMDSSHYGSAAWNPLGEVIRHGDTVIVKPNMVKSYEDDAQYECTLTHPAVIRAAIDYCVVAGAGKIILGDAPIQGADMDVIRKKIHIDELLEHYHKLGVTVEFEDFRDLIVTSVNGVIIPVKEKNADAKKMVTVDLGKDSCHYCIEDEKIYETCGYTNDDLNKHHHAATHEYVIAKSILDADVIINLPKPKTHRFAGITAAQKNFVGICADKESVPHYIAGTKESGGDETNKNTLLSQSISFWYRKYLKACKNGNRVSAFIFLVVHSALKKISSSNLYTHGAWYGNDTIWRSIIDLNHILRYANKEGEMNYSMESRTIFTIGDMIVAGEKEGPLQPSPKPLGMIMASYNCTVFDYVFCKITGFNDALIPTITSSVNDKLLYSGDIRRDVLFSNNPRYNGVSFDNLTFEDNFHFEPHSFWKAVLSK